MLTPEEVRYVAMLARIGLSDGEVEQMQRQLFELLDYVAVLNSIDTSYILPTAQVLATTNVTREDRARSSWPAEELLAGAPGREENFIRVPAVLEEFKDDTVRSGKGQDNV